MLTLCRLSEPQISLLYEQQMRRDFPPSELKHLSSILAMVRKDIYDVLGAYEEGRIVAYALLYRPEDERVVLLDYLAVETDMRGKGIGSWLLAQLRTYYHKSAEVLLIECERPKSAPDEAEARKRIRFYTQAGAVLTPVRIWLFDVEYSILVMPCAQRMPQKDWAEQMLRLYRQMLPKELYDAKVRLLRGNDK